jgi:hypothetical protein
MLHIVVSGERKVHRQTLLHRIYFALTTAGIPVHCEEPPPPALAWPSADVHFVNWASQGQAVHLSETSTGACDFTMTLEMEINEEDLRHEAVEHRVRVAVRDSAAAAAAVWADEQSGSHDYVWMVRDNRTGETVQIDTEGRRHRVSARRGRLDPPARDRLLPVDRLMAQRGRIDLYGWGPSGETLRAYPGQTDRGAGDLSGIARVMQAPDPDGGTSILGAPFGSEVQLYQTGTFGASPCSLKLIPALWYNGVSVGFHLNVM